MLRHKGTQPLETQRLSLRRFTYGDNQQMLENWMSDPQVQDIFGEPVLHTLEQGRALLDRYMEGYQRQDTYRWAITSRETGECAGMIAIYLVDDTHHWGELEYCLGTAFHNRGYVTEAVREILRFAFREVGFHKIQICHKATNPQSRRVIEKCGLRYDGTLRDHYCVDGVYIDRLYHSILREEWLAQEG